MSAIATGQAALPPAAFDLHQLLQTPQEMFQIRASTKQLVLQFDLAKHLRRLLSVMRANCGNGCLHKTNLSVRVGRANVKVLDGN